MKKQKEIYHPVSGIWGHWFYCPCISASSMTMEVWSSWIRQIFRLVFPSSLSLKQEICCVVYCKTGNWTIVVFCNYFLLISCTEISVVVRKKESFYATLNISSIESFMWANDINSSPCMLLRPLYHLVHLHPVGPMPFELCFMFYNLLLFDWPLLIVA